MASRQVSVVLRPLLNPCNQHVLLKRISVAESSSLSNTRALMSRMQQPSTLPPRVLLPKTQPLFKIPKSLEMTQATTLSPTDVHLRGPCPPPVLKCPPPPCACPPPPEVVTLGQRVVRALWCLTRLAVYLAVVKFTIDEGLWGDSEETEELAKRMGLLSQATTKEDNQEKEGDGSKGGSTPSPKVLWNRLVLKTGEVFGLKP